MPTEEDSTRLERLIIDGDSRQALVDFLGKGPYAYSPVMKEHLESMVLLDRVKSLEYMLENLPDRPYEDMLDLLDLSLKEHKVAICHCILRDGNYGEHDEYEALVTLDNDEDLTDFWSERPFLWTEHELSELVDKDKFLLHYICCDYSFLDVGLDAAIMLAVVDIMCFYGESEDFDSPKRILQGVLGSSLSDDMMLPIIKHVIENGGNVKEWMRERFFESHPDDLLSILALDDALAGQYFAQQLKQMMVEGDEVPNMVYSILEGRPFRYTRHVMYLFEKAVKLNRIGFFEAFLPLLRSIPEDLYNRKMTTLFVTCIYFHRPEMCHILLNHDFDYEYEFTRYNLSAFRRVPPCLWEEQELADIISRDPRLAKHICILPKDLRDCGENPRMISLIIAMNHRFAAVLGKEYDSPSASLNVVLACCRPTREWAMIVRQLVQLGAEVTEEMKVRLAQRPVYNWNDSEVMQVLDEFLSIPDIKEAE